jgi:hypothetical protein
MFHTRKTTGEASILYNCNFLCISAVSSILTGMDVFSLHCTSRYYMWWYLFLVLIKYNIYNSVYCDVQSL